MQEFDLTKNPFWLLRTSIRARQQAIVEAFERALSEGMTDERDLLRAQQIILGPRTRLEAELTWLPDLNPARAAKTVGLLASCPPKEIALQLLDGVEGLSRINLTADICGRYPPSDDLLNELRKSYKDMQMSDVEEVIQASRAASGFSRLDTRTVATAFQAIQGIHAKAAVECLAVLSHPGNALMTLIHDPSDPDSLQSDFFDALVYEYGKRFDGRLREIGDCIREGLAKLKLTPDDSEELSTIGTHIRRWAEWSLPVEIWERGKGLTDHRSSTMYTEIRDSALIFANQMNEYEVALSLTGYLRANFTTLPGIDEQLHEDAATLKHLISERRVSLAIHGLEVAIEQVTDNLQALQSSLLSNGFGVKSSGRARKLYEEFINSTETVHGTEHSDAPFRLIRSVSIQLNNSDFQQAAEMLLSSLLTSQQTSLSTELASTIESDLRTVRNNLRWQQIQYLIKTSQRKAALPLIEESIKNEDPGEGREHLTQLYAGIQRQLAVDDRRRKATLIKWGGGAILVVAIIAIKSCSSDNTASHSAPTSAPASQASSGADGSSGFATATNQGPPSSSDSFLETKPPAGRDVALSLSQLRYCQFQHARIARAKALTTNNEEIDFVNAAVDDFNSRCGSYRYDQSDMTVVQAELEQRRAEIESDAHRLLMKGSLDQ